MLVLTLGDCFSYLLLLVGCIGSFVGKLENQRCVVIELETGNVHTLFNLNKFGFDLGKVYHLDRVLLHGLALLLLNKSYSNKIYIIRGTKIVKDLIIRKIIKNISRPAD
jgi:hypothetical protein